MSAIRKYIVETIDAIWRDASPATRLQWAVDLYAPLGFRKDGRRVRKGVIDKAEFRKLISEAR